MKIWGYRTWSADLRPVLERIPFIPAFIRILGAALQLTDDPLDGSNDSPCCEVFAKTLVGEYKCRISAGTLPVLTEEKGSEATASHLLLPPLETRPA